MAEAERTGTYLQRVLEWSVRLPMHGFEYHVSTHDIPVN